MPETANNERLVPILFIIDVEPEEFFIDRNVKERWYGWEKARDASDAFRERMERATGRPVNFVWSIRSDTQITETYGSPVWAVENQPGHIEHFVSAGDALCAHVHPYRWSEAKADWIANYGDPDWVEEEVDRAIDAIDSVLPTPTEAFTMGNHFQSQRAIEQLERRGIKYEMTVPPGIHGAFRESALGEFTGEYLDCRQVPREVYRPSTADFRVADPTRKEGLWMLPLTSRVAGVRRSLRGLFSDWKFERGGRTRPEALALRFGPWAIHDYLDHYMNELTRPHLSFVARTALFHRPKIWKIVERSFDHMFNRYGGNRFCFTTPDEVVRMNRPDTVAANPQLQAA